MILSAAACGPDRLEADIAIIGAGAAGITLAQALVDAGRSVVLVESGDDGVDPARQARFAAEIAGEPMDAEALRIRSFGGATIQWTGRCAPLDPDDFGERPWVADTGWPIDPARLAPWYANAAALIGLDGERSAPAGPLEALRGKLAGEAALRPFSWLFAPVGRDLHRHFGDAHWDELEAAGNVRVLLEADCVALEAEGSRVSAAHLVDRNGRSLRVAARHFVITAGAIESVRLLMESGRHAPQLTGAVSNWLGRGFMQHVRIAAGEIVPADDGGTLQRLLNRFRRPRGVHDETGITLDPAWCAERRLGNAVAVLRYDPRGLLPPPWRWPDAATRAVRGHEPMLHRPRIELLLDLEQGCDPDSRITLSALADPHGRPRARIDWRIGGLEAASAQVFAEEISGWLSRAGLGALMIDESLRRGELARARCQESLHHLGGARMSGDGVTGVVDADLRVHGTANLHLCSGAVFPTGGHANPTLTIVALALRLAATLSA